MRATWREAGRGVSPQILGGVRGFKPHVSAEMSEREFSWLSNAAPSVGFRVNTISRFQSEQQQQQIQFYSPRVLLNL